MMAEKVKNILRKHGLKVTQARLKILSSLIEKNTVSCKELKEDIGIGIDRVSVYRILHHFMDKGIIFKFLHPSGEIGYRYCEESAFTDKESAHFNCKSCNGEVQLPAFPKEYLKQLECIQIIQFNIHAEGFCKDCAESNQ